VNGTDRGKKAVRSLPVPPSRLAHTQGRMEEDPPPPPPPPPPPAASESPPAPSSPSPSPSPSLNTDHDAWHVAPDGSTRATTWPLLARDMRVPNHYAALLALAGETPETAQQIEKDLPRTGATFAVQGLLKPGARIQRPWTRSIFPPRRTIERTNERTNDPRALRPPPRVSVTSRFLTTLTSARLLPQGCRCGTRYGTSSPPTQRTTRGRATSSP
jgi:hypothetical protein